MPKPTIFTTPTCVYCKMTKAFMQKNNIEYDEKDVSSDDAAREEMIQKSGQMGVPVTIIGDNVIVGFDESALRKLLDVQ